MLEFDEEEHRYFDGGVELPSVTTITRFCSVDSKRLREQIRFTETGERLYTRSAPTTTTPESFQPERV